MKYDCLRLCYDNAFHLNLHGLMYTFLSTTVELQWLEHPWNYKDMFETAIVRADEC